MDRRNFLKAGLLGGVAVGLPVSKAQASENLPPIPTALGMLYDSTLCVGAKLVWRNVSKSIKPQ